MIHQTLANGRWQTMTLAEQLGNVGSEFERAWSWKSKNDQQKFRSALERFLELMNFTVSDPRWTGHRRRELARLREQSLEELLKPDADSTASLSLYYLNFAIAARANH